MGTLNVMAILASVEARASTPRSILLIVPRAKPDSRVSLSWEYPFERRTSAI